MKLNNILTKSTGKMAALYKILPNDGTPKGYIKAMSDGIQLTCDRLGYRIKGDTLTLFDSNNPAKHVNLNLAYLVAFNEKSKTETRLCIAEDVYLLKTA
jgi:hypothetical protein